MNKALRYFKSHWKIIGSALAMALVLASAGGMLGLKIHEHNVQHARIIWAERSARSYKR